MKGGVSTMFKKVVLPLLFSSLLLASCVSEIPPTSPPPPPKEITGYNLLDAKTAVLTADAVLTNCYSYLLKEGYGTPGTDDAQFYSWGTFDFEYKLSPGDIVAVLEENDGKSRVVIPYGDLPWLYGYVSSDLLSTKEADILSGNQAILEDCQTYDAPSRNSLYPTNARGKILSYEGEWAKVQEYGTGAERYWVQTADLSFDFDSALPDRPQ